MGTNEVEVPEQQLLQQADAIGATAASTDAAAAELGGAAMQAESWVPLVQELFPAVHFLAIPAWQVPQVGFDKVTGGIGRALDMFFPGGPVSPKWLPFVQIFAGMGVIVIANFDRSTGKLPPLGVKGLLKNAENQKSATAAEPKPAASSGPDPYAPAGGAATSS